MQIDDLPSANDVYAAANRLHGVAVRTPTFSNVWLNRAVGQQVWLKAESLQHTGSFKFRGAYNRLAQLSEAERASGVVAWSSGNHAQGVAYAAALLGVPARIVMPADAPLVKRANTEALGADVVAYDRWTQDREAIARQLAATDGAVVVPSFDDRDVIAGQGTVALELLNDCPAKLDALLVCCSGGGLMAGCALAAEARSPTTVLYTVEPEGFDDYARSLASGVRCRNGSAAQSSCDALLAPTPGEMTFAINRGRVMAGLTVSEEEVERAVVFAFQRLRLVLEPGGAVALAAVLAGKVPVQHNTVGVILSGANVDPVRFSRLVSTVRVDNFD